MSHSTRKELPIVDDQKKETRTLIIALEGHEDDIALFNKWLDENQEYFHIKRVK